MKLHTKFVILSMMMPLLTGPVFAQQVPAKQLQTGAAAGNLGFTPLAPANNLSDIPSASSARINSATTGNLNAP